MRKITSFYYIDYPNDMPNDPLDAYSEIYVEIGDEGSTIHDFEQTFALHVYTELYIKKNINKDGYIALGSAIIVNRFEDKIIEKALYSIIENIEDYGIRVGL